MGHYDTCRPENCPLCGQALGYCDHNLVPVQRKTTRRKTTSPIPPSMRFDFKKLIEDAIALDPRYLTIAEGFVKRD